MKALTIIIFTYLLSAISVFASDANIASQYIPASKREQNKYRFPISFSTNPSHQDSGIDAAVSITNLYKYFNDRFDEPGKILSIHYLLRLILLPQIFLWNHEITGHGFRCNEVGIPVI